MQQLTITIPPDVAAWLSEEQYPDEKSTAETVLRKLTKLMELEQGGM